MKSEVRFLLASDLDRTMIPNGVQEANPGAIPRLKTLLESNPDVALAYISGRDFGLLFKGLEEYSLPTPDIIVCDVGTRIYLQSDGGFIADEGWSQKISADWPKDGNKEINEALRDLHYLVEQEPEKNSFHKQSYYMDNSANPEQVLEEIKKRLREHEIDAQVIYSLDEVEDIGLVDLIPVNAAKDAAVHYLKELLGLDNRHVLYAGDSGNDILALTSGVCAVVVNNAISSVREDVGRAASEKNISDNVYFAVGRYGCGQGFYTDGVIEGALHFRLFNQTEGET